MKMLTFHLLWKLCYEPLKHAKSEDRYIEKIETGVWQFRKKKKNSANKFLKRPCQYRIFKTMQQDGMRIFLNIIYQLDINKSD